MSGRVCNFNRRKMEKGIIRDWHRRRRVNRICRLVDRGSVAVLRQSE